MRLLVFGSVGGVRELLVAVELDGELAAERFLTRVGSNVDLPVLGSGERPVAIFELKKNISNVSIFQIVVFAEASLF